MAEKKVQLSKKDRLSVALRSTFLQGSWNYERMQNGGWCFAMIPAIKKLYTNKEDQIAALKRHLEFFNTHPYVASPVIGVTLALEEDKANGAPVEDSAIQGVKVGMMGPLAGVGDLVHSKTYPWSFRSFSCNGWKHPWSSFILRIMERYPLGIYVVYTGIWLQRRNKDHRRLIWWITSESYKRSIYPWYVRPWCIDRTLGKYQLYSSCI